MKKTIIAAFLTLFVVNFTFSQTELEIKKEKEIIKKVIQTAYVEGLQNEGDFDKIDAGFHPAFQLLGIDQGQKIWSLPIYSWKETIKQRKTKAEYPKAEDKKVSIKFVFIDITGTAAMAKFQFFVGKELKYVDYMSLYKFDDQWKIVNKIFYKFPEKDK